MLREWLPLTSSGYPSTQTGPAPLTPYLKYSVSASLISLPLSSDFLLSYLLFLFTLFHPSHFSPSISLVHPSFHFPSAIHHSLVLFFSLPPFPFPLFPSCSPSPTPISRSLFCLKFPPCGCVLLTSHLLWCELHICEWMTGKINNPAFPFSLTVGLSNE